jgi:hypothetical protein
MKKAALAVFFVSKKNPATGGMIKSLQSFSGAAGHLATFLYLHGRW